MTCPGKARRVLVLLSLIAASALASDGLDGDALAPGPSTPPPALARRARLDLTAGPVTPELVAAHGLADARGLFVHAVTPGGEAERAGLGAGDVLLALDGRPLRALEELLAAVASRRAGETLALTRRRHARRHLVTLRLGPLPAERGDGLEVVHGSLRAAGGLVRTITTWPERLARPPAVLVVHPDTGRPVEDPFAERAPLRDLLHGLTRAGFVTRRVERPGRGDSPPGPTTPRAERAIFAAALEQLARDPRIDPDGVFVLATGAAAPLARELAQASGARALVTLDSPGGARAVRCPELAVGLDAWPRAAERLAGWMHALVQARR